MSVWGNFGMGWGVRGVGVHGHVWAGQNVLFLVGFMYKFRLLNQWRRSHQCEQNARISQCLTFGM